MGQYDTALEDTRYFFSSILRVRMLIALGGVMCLLYHALRIRKAQTQKIEVAALKGLTISARACATSYLACTAVFYFTWSHFPDSNYHLRCFWHTSQFFSLLVVLHLAVSRRASPKLAAVLVCLQLAILPICGATNRMPLPMQPTTCPTFLHHLAVIFSVCCSVLALQGECELTVMMRGEEDASENYASFAPVSLDDGSSSTLWLDQQQPQGIAGPAAEGQNFKRESTIEKREAVRFSLEAVVLLCSSLSMAYLLIMFGDAWLSFYENRHWDTPSFLGVYKSLHDAQITGVMYHFLWSYLPYAYSILFLLYMQKPVENGCLSYCNMFMCLLGAWHFVVLEAGALSCRAAGDISDCYQRAELAITLHFVESICFSFSLVLFFLHRCCSPVQDISQRAGSLRILEGILTMAALIGFGIMLAETFLVWDKKFAFALPDDVFQNRVHLWPFPGYQILTHFLCVLPTIFLFSLLDIWAGQRTFIYLVEEEYDDVMSTREKQLTELTRL